MKSNVVLIGMPGAGKSTIGVILAKRMGFQFIDTDLIIQTQEKCRLQQIIDTHGVNRFRQIEEQVLLNLDSKQNIIATGGSAVYSGTGLKKLGMDGCKVYIDVPIQVLEQRIADMGQRGLVIDKGQTFSQLYQERTPLYEKFADLTIFCTAMTAEQIAAKIEEQIQPFLL